MESFEDRLSVLSKLPFAVFCCLEGGCCGGEGSVMVMVGGMVDIDNDVLRDVTDGVLSLSGE